MSFSCECCVLSGADHPSRGGVLPTVVRVCVFFSRNCDVAALVRVGLLGQEGKIIHSPICFG
jgi:hypothetical protein